MIESPFLDQRRRLFGRGVVGQRGIDRAARDMGEREYENADREERDQALADADGEELQRRRPQERRLGAPAKMLTRSPRSGASSSARSKSRRDMSSERSLPG